MVKPEHSSSISYGTLKFSFRQDVDSVGHSAWLKPADLLRFVRSKFSLSSLNSTEILCFLFMETSLLFQRRLRM